MKMSCLDDLTSAADLCLDEGFAFFPGLIDEPLVEKIQSELNPWMERPAVGGAGYISAGGDHLLSDIGLYSSAVLKMAVDERVLNMLENIFGTPAILTDLSFRRRMTCCQEMPLHADIGDGIIIFIYLNGVSPSLGSTCVIPKTHVIGADLNNGYLQVPKELIEKHRQNLVIPEGPLGSVLIFDQDVWHLRTPVTELGRELLWITYKPIERAPKYANTKLSVSFLAGLSKRQIQALVPATSLAAPSSEFFSRSNEIAENTLLELPSTQLCKILIKRAFFTLKSILRPLIRSIIPAKTSEYRKKIDQFPPPRIRVRLPNNGDLDV